MNRNLWIIVLLALFFLSMLAYPSSDQALGRWPVNFIVTVAICVLYALLYAVYIDQKLKRED